MECPFELTVLSSWGLVRSSPISYENAPYDDMNYNPFLYLFLPSPLCLHTQEAGKHKNRSPQGLGLGTQGNCSSLLQQLTLITNRYPTTISKQVKHANHRFFFSLPQLARRKTQPLLGSTCLRLLLQPTISTSFLIPLPRLRQHDLVDPNYSRSLT